MGSGPLGRRDDILTRQFTSDCNLSFTAHLIFLESSQRQKCHSEDIGLSLPVLNHFTDSTEAHRNIPKIFKIVSAIYLIAEGFASLGFEHIFLEMTAVQVLLPSCCKSGTYTPSPSDEELKGHDSAHFQAPLSILKCMECRLCWGCVWVQKQRQKLLSDCPPPPPPPPPPMVSLSDFCRCLWGPGRGGSP